MPRRGSLLTERMRMISVATARDTVKTESVEAAQDRREEGAQRLSWCAQGGQSRTAG